MKIDIACLIDDDRLFTFGIKKLMHINDFCETLMVFKNGEEAFKHLSTIVHSAKELPDVILLDINMPVMDGWEFLDNFVTIQPKLAKKVTIFMVSSSVDKEDIDRAKSYSLVSDYIVKPISEQELNKIASYVKEVNS